MGSSVSTTAVSTSSVSTSSVSTRAVARTSLDLTTNSAPPAMPNRVLNGPSGLIPDTVLTGDFRGVLVLSLLFVTRRAIRACPFILLPFGQAARWQSATLSRTSPSGILEGNGAYYPGPLEMLTVVLGAPATFPPVTRMNWGRRLSAVLLMPAVYMGTCSMIAADGNGSADPATAGIPTLRGPSVEPAVYLVA